ncbi:MAG: tetratricopeptide repeat protein [Chloroflexi bacterium]|nr:tetratricopeptide repeat protein [Chloroflexota bacterium]
MAHFDTEERARVKRVKIEQAVNLAMQSRWAEAADLNRQLIDSYPKEVEAYNRLGKSLLELGQYDDSLEAYNHALRLEPMNTIAQKNAQRLEMLRTEMIAAIPSSGPVDPSLFIAETGRATVTALVELATSEVLATVNAGDSVSLLMEDSIVSVSNSNGDRLGKLEPRLRQRLIRLTQMGNEYSAVITGVDDQSVRVIIRETHRDPSMGDRPSFPTSGETFRGYIRDSLIRYELDDEDDDELEESEAEPEHDHDIEPEAEVDPDADLVHEVLAGAEDVDDEEP